MFNFLSDIGNYDQRSVAKDEYGWGFISTCFVSDGVKPYETAVMSREYVDENDKTDNMVIVDNYSTIEEAEAGHAKWKTTMESDTKPKELTDCNNGLNGMFGDMGIKETYVGVKDGKSTSED